MRIGELRHRLTLERPVNNRSPSGTGGMGKTWELVKEGIPARIVPLSARELFAAQAVQSSVTSRITLRWMAGITADMRLRNPKTGKVYNIAGVIPDQVSGLQELTIPVSDGVNDG